MVKSTEGDQTAELERCGSFGCTLPKGHNMGRMDVPENHQSADYGRSYDDPNDPKPEQVVDENGGLRAEYLDWIKRQARRRMKLLGLLAEDDVFDRGGES